MSKEIETMLVKRLTDNIIFVLKKDLKTENYVFTAGTRVVFEEKDYAIYSCYHVYSANKTDYMYIHRTEELIELFENILETDANRTDQYRSFLYKEHINVSVIITIILHVLIFIALLFSILTADNMNFFKTSFLIIVSFSVTVVLGLINIGFNILETHEKAKIKLKHKRRELLQ